MRQTLSPLALPATHVVAPSLASPIPVTPHPPRSLPYVDYSVLTQLFLTFSELLPHSTPVFHRSKPPVSPPEVKLPVSNLLPKLPASRPPPPVASRNLTDTNLVPSLFVRSEDTRNRPSCSFANSRSSVSFEKSPRTSRLISDFSPLPSELCKNPPKPTSCHCLKIPTWLPSMLSV